MRLAKKGVYDDCRFESTADTPGAEGCPHVGMAARFDPFDISDPFPFYAQARAEQPVFFSEAIGYWVVSRYDDVKAIFRDHETFSSEVTQTPYKPRPAEVQQVLEARTGDLSHARHSGSGCARVVLADRNADGAGALAAEVADRDGQALSVAADVTSADSTWVLAEQADAWGGAIDILINNAAIYAGLERRPFWELDEAEWDRVLGVNLKGAWLCAKAVFPAMRRRGRGKIINVASATVFSGSPLWAHYVASKGGVIALTHTMAREAGDNGMTVNALAPGFTLTDASLGLIEDAANYGVNRGAIKRPAYAEDMVGAAIFLASSASDFMTGQTLIVDGGRQFI